MGAGQALVLRCLALGWSHNSSQPLSRTSHRAPPNCSRAGNVEEHEYYLVIATVPHGMRHAGKSGVVLHGWCLLCVYEDYWAGFKGNDIR